MIGDILDWVRPVLVDTPTRWKNLTEALPAELLMRRPAPSEWPAVDCLQHLVDTERWVFPVRIKAFLSGQSFPAFDPDHEGTRPDAALSPAALAAEFARLRLESLNVLTTVTVSDLDKRNHHPELGPVTLSELIHEWAAHDLMHTVQAERAVMQPFIAGSGPWRIYFTDHIAKQA